MISNTMTITITHEQASLIKNLLNKERMYYKSLNKEEGIYIRTIEDTITAMETH